jgi:DNA-binding IclR family transcriptional regulator
MVKKIGAQAGAGPRRQSIQSVEIGLAVLDALVKPGKPSGLSLVAQASGLSTPQAHRYLGSLINTGMARQDASSGRYGLGPAALRLGLGALAVTDVYRIADEEIGAFSAETGRTLLVAALGPTGPIVIRWHAGSPPVVTSLAVGSSLPLLRSATGHVFLAFTPEAETADLVAREREIAALLPIDVDGVRARVRAAGSADVDGSLIPGLRAVAMPIIDMQGKATLAVTLLWTDSFSRTDDLAIRPGFAEMCGRITTAVGGTPPATSPQT